MKLLEFFSEDQADWEIKNLNKLDRILTKLTEMVIQGQDKDPDYYGMVAAAVLDPDNNLVARLNFPGKDGKRIHAERAAMMAYTKKYGEIPEGSIIITTLSPCSDHMDDRVGESCTDLINQSPVHKVYCGYMDPTQHEHDTRQFTLQETNSKNLRKACKALADTFLKNVDEAIDNIDNFINESINVDEFKEILKKFLPFAKKIVKLDNMPTIVLKKTLSLGDQPTMGKFHNELYTLELAIANRQPVDILRTLAHELVHARQHEQHVDIDPTTGSPEENEANAVAGIVMRHFNKEYPEYLTFQPLEESKSNGRKRIC